MKTNRKYTNLAVINTLFELYRVEDLANEVVDNINKHKKDSVELESVKKSSFIIRKMKDASVTAADIKTFITDSITEMLDDKLDEVLDYLSDNYDLAYDSFMIDDAFVDDIFDITRSGRLFYIEADM